MDTSGAYLQAALPQVQSHGKLFRRIRIVQSRCLTRATLRHSWLQRMTEHLVISELCLLELFRMTGIV